MAESASEVSLEELYSTHVGKVSDKWSIYISEYGRLFDEFRSSPIRLLEIGIQNGGSLEIWAQYFPHAAKIVGCDIDTACAGLEFEDSRIQVVIGDANTDGTQARVLKHSHVFDLIIDDGSHRTGDIVKSFARYFPSLSDGGLFVVEDLHCSYWKDFEGGLFDPYSSMAFFKHLIDVLNHEHWGVNRSRTGVLTGVFRRYAFSIEESTLQMIHSVEFINSLCVVRKRRFELNGLGTRVIAGTVEEVAQGHIHQHGTAALSYSQVRNRWAVGALGPEEVQLRSDALAERNAHIAEFRSPVTAEADHEYEMAAHKLISDRDGQLFALNAIMVEKEQRLQSLYMKLDEGLSQFAALHQRLSERQERVVQLVGAVAEKEAQIAQLTFAITNSYQSVEQTERMLAVRDQTIEGLILSITERDGQISRMHVTVGQRDAEFGELARQLSLGDAQLNIASSKLIERDAELEDAQRALGEIELRTDRLCVELEQLRGAVATRDEQLLNAHVELESIKTKRLANRIRRYWGGF